MNSYTCDAVLRAREILRDPTPLHRDCGRICGRRCCASMPGETTGMLLFPGEEGLYIDAPGMELLSTLRGILLVCGGSCKRTERPLACRMFPLAVTVRDGKPCVEKDARARYVCPLADAGLDALDQGFVRAVREAGVVLFEDETQRRFLEELTEEQDELTRLRREWGG